jgi:hypothetical protein
MGEGENGGITTFEAEGALVPSSNEHAKGTTDLSGGGMCKKGQAALPRQRSFVGLAADGVVRKVLVRT